MGTRPVEQHQAALLSLNALEILFLRGLFSMVNVNAQGCFFAGQEK